MYVIKDKAREDSPRMPPCKISSINPIRNAENRPIMEGVIIVKNINDKAIHGTLKKDRYSGKGIMDRRLERININQTKEIFDNCLLIWVIFFNILDDQNFINIF